MKPLEPAFGFLVQSPTRVSFIHGVSIWQLGYIVKSIKQMCIWLVAEVVWVERALWVIITRIVRHMWACMVWSHWSWIPWEHAYPAWISLVCEAMRPWWNNGCSLGTWWLCLGLIICHLYTHTDVCERHWGVLQAIVWLDDWSFAAHQCVMF